MYLKEKHLATRFFIVFCILRISFTQAFAQQTYDAYQLKEDLLFYKSKLEQFHPNLYLYVSQEEFNRFFDSVFQSINSPLDEVDFYALLSQTSSLIKDGHTLILPSDHFTAYHNAKSQFLPFQIELYQ